MPCSCECLQHQRIRITSDRWSMTTNRSTSTMQTNAIQSNPMNSSYRPWLRRSCMNRLNRSNEPWDPWEKHTRGPHDPEPRMLDEHERYRYVHVSRSIESTATTIIISACDPRSNQNQPAQWSIDIDRSWCLSRDTDWFDLIRFDSIEKIMVRFDRGSIPPIHQRGRTTHCRRRAAAGSRPWGHCPCTARPGARRTCAWWRPPCCLERWDIAPGDRCASRRRQCWAGRSPTPWRSCVDRPLCSRRSSRKL